MSWDYNNGIRNPNGDDYSSEDDDDDDDNDDDDLYEHGDDDDDDEELIETDSLRRSEIISELQASSLPLLNNITA
jgi:hypothetical protein